MCPADGETMGEIVMRGNNVMKGYFEDEEATAEAFRGGWFHSGDLGVMQPDGYVQLRDRAKDVVVSGGENISTVEIEQALLTHEAVLDVAVIGVPDEKWGERPKAFVVLKPGAEAGEQELIDHVKLHDRPLQGAQGGRLPGRAAEDLDGQGPEVRAPRARVGRASVSDQGVSGWAAHQGHHARGGRSS